MKKYLLLLFCNVFILSIFSLAAQRTITGKITDAADGSEMIGVSVTLKSSKVGAISDVDGKYSITVPDDEKKSILVFSYLGFDQQEIEVGSLTTVNVKMKESSVSLNEVVVTGFKDVKKEMFTGSSAKVNMEDLKLAGGIDASRMLEGKVAGVSVQNVSSTFGTAPKVRIRGVTSINGENKPLWVVDNVILEDIVNVSNDQLSSGDPTTLLGSPVAGLSTSDIESMTILKDAEATAQYGARAMNGVIVITTKRGKSGAPRITYNGNFTVRAKPDYANFDIMNSADQMAVNVELQRKGWLPPDMMNWKNYGPYGNMAASYSNWNPDTGEWEILQAPEVIKAYLKPYALANTDWFGLLFTNNLMQEHSLDISAGTDNSKTYGSLSFLDDPGATIADNVKRYTFNMRNDYTINSRLSTVISVNGSYRDQRVPGSSNRKVDPVRGSFSRDFDINPFSYAYNTSRAIRAYDDAGNLEYVTMNYAPFNILHELANNWMDLSVIDVKAQGEVNYTLLKDTKKSGNLQYHFIGALRYMHSGNNYTITETANAAEAYRAIKNTIVQSNNPWLWKDPSDPAGNKIVVLPQGGFFNQNVDEMQNYYIRNTLNYSKTWEGKRIHEFTLLGGQDVKYIDRYATTSIGDGYLYYNGQRFVENPDYSRMLAYGSTAHKTSTFNYERYVAFFLSGDYAFDRRYSVSASTRYDGSNLLGKDAAARWLATWTFAGKWNVINEKFMENAKKSIDELALRCSYGLTASMPPTANSQAVFYDDFSYAPGYQQDIITRQNLGNKDLTWEKDYMLNFAIDASFFKGRLSTTVEWWQRNSFDLISDIEGSGIGGVLYKQGNYADLHNRGVDIMLDATPVVTKDWRWIIGLTFGSNLNKIKNAKNAPQVMDLVAQTGGNINGYPVHSLFSIPFYGLDPQNGMPLFLQPDGSKPSGYADMQSLNTAYLKYEGPVDPPYTGGLNNTVKYRQFTLNVFLSYQWGNVVRLNPSFSENYTDLDALSKDFKNRWMQTGDELTTNVPSIPYKITSLLYNTTSYPYNNYNFSSARVAKGDFVRMKSISLSYNFPDAWLQKATKMVFRTALFRITGKDLWLIYADKRLHGQDPEFLNTGGVALPALPQGILSVTLGF